MKWASTYLLLLRNLDDEQIMLLGECERDIREDERDRVCQRIEAERLTDGTGTAEDEAYNSAVNDCLRAVRGEAS